MLSYLLLLSALPMLVSAQAQTSAICAADFAWMTNSKGSSPCLAVAQLDAVCNNGNWVIKPLNASVHYTNPKLADFTVSFCTCSWASYNLLSACTACQGFPEQTPFWGDYSSECAGKLSNEYFPSNITLPDTITIPFWASNDPKSWANQKFSSTQAKQIQAQGHPDLRSPATTPQPSSKKSTPVGAIVGGVIGGLVVIGIAIALAFFMLRRQSKHLHAKSTAMEGNDGRPPHMRNISDTTMNSGMKSMTYTTLTSSGPMMMTNPPTSPTIRTHNTSEHSLPYSTATPFSSPPPPLPRTSPSLSRSDRTEDIIVPFVLPPTVDNPDRKQANGEYPVWDSPSAPPVNSNIMRVQSSVTRTPTERARYNPPAYAESSPSRSGTGTPPRHNRGPGSSDTGHSVRSNGVTQPSTPGHSPANSGSNIYAPMPMAIPDVSAAPAYPMPGNTMSQGYGQQVGPAADLKRRPTADSITGGDIA